MELDYRAIGEAAVKAYHNIMHPLDLHSYEAAGRAAVAAIIPATHDIEHLGLFGICTSDCPFYGNDEQSGYSCSIGFGAIHRMPETHMKPGPSCPASKGGGNG